MSYYVKSIWKGEFIAEAVSNILVDSVNLVVGNPGKPRQQTSSNQLTGT